MQHKVLNTFHDRESGVLFTPGSFFESENYERVTDLNKQGFIIANQKSFTLKVEKSEEDKSKVKRTRQKKASE